ncbi:hypothetical protein BE20_44410 [Sorangium cellulosum]|uniref:Uncharacterized protein n=1 Tax=Sorangium cellulosum TaxID=56 RepID=A0A150RHC2_SORCE|nr:hypothetical protein BE18_44775 [Sorangium cellulosum]KYF95744.1 hypothetical protein BE20_44410 [Sorangium cellulosum]
MLEARLLGLLRDDGGASGIAELLVTIAQAEQDPQLYPQPPPIDPSEGRRSSAELRRLLQALQCAPPEPPPSRPRAGYTLEGAPDGEARALPAFAGALGSGGSLRKSFPDLWALDAALWNRLDSADVRELARLWLESPGRRLVQDLRVLTSMPAGEPLGATDLSFARLEAAAGWRPTPGKAASPLDEHRGYRELHLAVPGAHLEDWEPEPSDKAEQVLRALHLLEDGSPLGLRGAALAWLLNSAADDPFYTVNGIRRDLRDDLPIRLSTALPAWVGDDPRTTVPRQLEVLMLQHAARIIAAGPAGDAAPRGWALARWLQGCLRRSPFFGADEEVLAAHLRARLPAAPLPVPDAADALHPARFPLDGAGLNVAEIALMAGVLAHYQRPHDHTLLPTPVPLVHALQQIARRPIRPAEEDADAALIAGHNALGWPEDYSIAPPLAARRLMTDLRIGWLAQIGEAAQSESIERFAKDPVRHGWLAFAVHREGQHLGPGARTLAIDVFRALSSACRAEAYVLGTFGTGLLEGLSESETDVIVSLAMNAEPLWRPFVIDALAGAAERIERGATWARAIEHLLALMEDGLLDEKVRLNAALFALRRASASKIAGRDALLARIAAVATAPPFNDHLGLRREIRRLGLPPPAAAGFKR